MFNNNRFYIREFPEERVQIKPFRLMDLPAIPFSRIAKICSDQELTYLTLISATTARVFQQFPRTKGRMSLKITKTQGRVKFSPQKLTIKWRGEDIKNLMEMLSRVLKLWNVPFSQIKVDVRHLTELEKHEFWLRITKCDILEFIYEGSRRNVENERKIKRILDRMQIGKELFIGCPNIIHKKVFNVAKVTIQEAKWISKEELVGFLNETTRFVQLEEHNLTERDLREFMSLWKRAPHNNLEVLIIGSEGTKQWNQWIIDDGSNARMWSPLIRDRIFFPFDETFPRHINDQNPNLFNSRNIKNGVHLEEALDIRNTTFTIASVLQTSTQFAMFVWKDRFASAKYIPILRLRIVELERKVIATTEQLRNLGQHANYPLFYFLGARVRKLENRITMENKKLSLVVG